MLLQVFDLRKADLNYTLAIKQTLTIKPKDFYIHVSLREGIDAVHLDRLLKGHGAEESKWQEPQVDSTSASLAKPLAVYFAGNMGTCESLAQTVAHSAPSHGFKAEIKSKDRPVLVIASSYEGEPPDNAVRFVKWIEGLIGKPLEGLQFSVFGCGNRDWRDTFQRISDLIHATLGTGGGKMFAEQGIADVADSDVFNDFEKWEDRVFWPAMDEIFGSGEDGDVGNGGGLDLDIATTLRSSHLRQDVKEAIVFNNEILNPSDDAPKRHIEIRLPTDMEYKAGDYLAILPMNPTATVRRVLKQFGLPWDAMITIKSGEATLPKDTPLSVYDLLSSYVELSQPATRRNLKKIIAVTGDESTRAELETLSGTAFGVEITTKRTSVLDLLEKYSSADITFSDFLSMLPQLRLRQYSISSSPLADPTICTLTLGVLDQEALQGGGKRFLGVASTFLSGLQPGDHIHVNVKASHPSFHLPTDTANTPLIMIAAGTGTAPFRGFVQERARLLEAGRRLAPPLLFVGCRHPEQDALYHEELATWAKTGAVDMRYAFSRHNGAVQYVQDRFWDDRKEAMELFAEGAKVFVCGHGRVADGVKTKIMRMYLERQAEMGAPKTEEEAEKFFTGLKNERFMSDIFD